MSDDDAGDGGAVTLRRCLGQHFVRLGDDVENRNAGVCQRFVRNRDAAIHHRNRNPAAPGDVEDRLDMHLGQRVLQPDVRLRIGRRQLA
jgi:hypothetical protein